MSKLSEGTKFDNGKERFDLLPPDVLFELAKVYTYGATKYEERNWEKGMNWGRLFAALMRHLWKWWRGETYDPESNIHHLSHALANVSFLLHYDLNYKHYKKWDDRPKKEEKEKKADTDPSEDS